MVGASSPNPKPQRLGSRASKPSTLEIGFTGVQRPRASGCELAVQSAGAMQFPGLTAHSLKFKHGTSNFPRIQGPEYVHTPPSTAILTYYGSPQGGTLKALIPINHPFPRHCPYGFALIFHSRA